MWGRGVKNREPADREVSLGWWVKRIPETMRKVRA